jgi:Na+/H+ antiporter NhaD/arsenite permease-like protein
MNLVGLLITLLIAVIVFWILTALTTTIVGVVGAILVLLAGIPSGGFGLGGRYGGRRAL